MPRCLVAYYSWTGNTAKVANAIAESMSADVEVIHDAKPRNGPLAFAATALASVLQRSAAIVDPTKSVGDYDLVILGSPVWGQNMATPIRTYIVRERPKLTQVALFCTLGGSGGKAALARMAALCERTSIADLIVEQSALASGTWLTLTSNFVQRLQKTEADLPGLAAA